MYKCRQLVYSVTQLNTCSVFRAHLKASSKMISEQLFTWEQPKRENRSSMVSDHFTVYRHKKRKKNCSFIVCVWYTLIYLSVRR